MSRCFATFPADRSRSATERTFVARSLWAAAGQERPVASERAEWDSVLDRGPPRKEG